jgi:hypothetical protein
MFSMLMFSLMNATLYSIQSERFRQKNEALFLRRPPPAILSGLPHRARLW